jgi:hypothetical protein
MKLQIQEDFFSTIANFLYELGAFTGEDFQTEFEISNMAGELIHGF